MARGRNAEPFVLPNDRDKLLRRRQLLDSAVWGASVRFENTLLRTRFFCSPLHHTCDAIRPLSACSMSAACANALGDACTQTMHYSSLDSHEFSQSMPSGSSGESFPYASPRSFSFKQNLDLPRAQWSRRHRPRRPPPRRMKRHCSGR